MWQWLRQQRFTVQNLGSHEKEPTSRKSASIVPPIDESYFLACRAGLECVLNQDKKQLLLYRPNHRWLIESSDNPPG